jgi:hypothetical protein
MITFNFGRQIIMKKIVLLLSSLFLHTFAQSQDLKTNLEDAYKQHRAKIAAHDYKYIKSLIPLAHKEKFGLLTKGEKEKAAKQMLGSMTSLDKFTFVKTKNNDKEARYYFYNEYAKGFISAGFLRFEKIKRDWIPKGFVRHSQKINLRPLKDQALMIFKKDKKFHFLGFP